MGKHEHGVRSLWCSLGVVEEDHMLMHFFVDRKSRVIREMNGGPSEGEMSSRKDFSMLEWDLRRRMVFMLLCARCDKFVASRFLLRVLKCLLLYRGMAVQTVVVSLACIICMLLAFLRTCVRVD